jgi:hypothetical protein
MKYKHNVIATVTRTITYEFEFKAFTNDPDGDWDEIEQQAIEHLKDLGVDRTLIEVLDDIEVLDEEYVVDDLTLLWPRAQPWREGGVD